MTTASAQFTPFLLELASVAEAVVMQHYRLPLVVDNKLGNAGFDPVTEADRAAEQAIRQCIAARFPAHGIIGEEYGRERDDAPLVWVIDPIDGTKAFVSGTPTWGILIALLEHGQPVLGLNAQPALGERFVGDGVVSMRHDRRGSHRLGTRPCANLADACVLVSSEVVRNAQMLARVQALAERTRMLEYSANCHSVAMLAEGHVDMVIGFGGFEIYDIAAHIPIVRGAGGVTTALDGGNALHANAMISSGDSRCHAQALQVLATVF